MGNGIRIIITSLTSFVSQIVTWFIGWIAGGSATVPQPAISLGTYWTSVLVSLVGKLSPWLGSSSWTPTIINLIGGWIILGLALLGAWSVFGKIATIVLAIAVVVLFGALVFGIKLPVTLPTLPTNSTLIP